MHKLSAAGPLYLRAVSVPLTSPAFLQASPAHRLPLLPSCTPGCSKREVRDSPDRGTPVIPFTGDRAETGVEGLWQNTGVSEGGHGRKEAGSQSRQPRNPSVRFHLWKEMEALGHGTGRGACGSRLGRQTAADLGTCLIVYFLTRWRMYTCVHFVMTHQTTLC